MPNNADYKPPKWITILILTWFFLGCLPILALAFGFRFLPSPEWVQNTRLIAALAAFGTAALMLVLLRIGHKKQKPEGGMIKIVGMYLVAVFLFSPAVGASAIAATGPMLVAIVAGSQSSLTYTVADASQSGSYKCRRPIKLTEAPFLFNLVCGTSQAFQLGVSKEDFVLVTGHGTRWGLFPRTISMTD
ncbi:hypothetical protein CLV80_10533 [Yoonia maritima]|uniref:Transmembrane protein n=1 Tax=Yoonia maritima TaxID=1435347 RepID=A0A2T0VZ01_9RHOB|nr:hypothetical protein [Yoonia maritima]PRY77551.1 hypothetical protein CLV80_10533 [Yoonia maritima]